jgi:Icc protein
MSPPLRRVWAPRIVLSMTTITWATDLHLDAAGADDYQSFITKTKLSGASALLLSGDISNGFRVKQDIVKVREEIGIPIYFVLGNHDYWGQGTVDAFREQISELCNGSDLVFLTTHDEPIVLSDTTVLVGHDGWADGKEGDFLNSTIVLRDYSEIGEFSVLSKEPLLKRLNALGEETASVLESRLCSAFDQANEVICVTHPPPFREGCLYDNKKSDDNWAPHFVCQSVGEMLLRLMPQHPTKNVVVLCGHSHHKADHCPLPNLRVRVGHAAYGEPSVQDVLSGI